MVPAQNGSRRMTTTTRLYFYDAATGEGPTVEFRVAAEPDAIRDVLRGMRW